MIDFKQNLHTHTWRCRHAEGREREYIEKAIRNKMTVLGFSDHTPYLFSTDVYYYSTFRMYPDQLEDYVDTILSLKREYASDIEILLGVEAEYYPDFFEATVERLEQYPFDYFILGQHFLGNEINDEYSGNVTHNEQVLKRYVNQTIDAMETGKFLYLAHPDLINYHGSSRIYEAEISKLCQAAKNLSIPLEINLLGIWQKRHYPNPAFWEIAGRIGNEVVLGADAHLPGKLYVKGAIRKAEKLIEANQLKLITDLKGLAGK